MKGHVTTFYIETVLHFTKREKKAGSKRDAAFALAFQETGGSTDSSYQNKNTPVLLIVLKSGFKEKHAFKGGNKNITKAVYVLRIYKTNQTRSDEKRNISEINTPSRTGKQSNQKRFTF